MEGNQKENTLGEWSDGDDDRVWEIDENTLGEWSDGDDDWVWEIDENTLGEWSDSDDDEIIRNVDENVQAGRGRKRKSDEADGGSSTSTVLPEENFYVIERVKEVKSSKFQTTGTDYAVRFNNTISDLDLVESLERTQEIFEHLLSDVTAGMNGKDQVRFVLRSTQLDTPISLPFMPLPQLHQQLHQAAGVPLGPCGIPEVEMFQNHLTNYEINIVSAEHNNSIIYPPKPSTSEAKPIYLYLHGGHYDVITSMPGFLSSAYFCHKCKRPYSNTLGHLCEGMCTSCRSFNCNAHDSNIDTNWYLECSQCNRGFNSQACYDRHKEPIGKGRSVCEGIKKCGKCGKSLELRHLDPKKHICGRKCRTCGVLLGEKDEHKCYIQKSEKKSEQNSEESQYNELLFFDFECTQEDGIHKANLCIVHDEAGHEKLFQGKDTTVDFCKWLFTKDHQDCIVVAHNFQGYDGYFIQKYLNENAVMYKLLLRGAKIVSLTIPMFNIKFIDSLNFIPMSLAKFPKTFGMRELCKGYFPHLFNKEENQNYVGPIPDADYYAPNTMKPEVREAFLTWHKEQRDNGYIFNFKEEIIKYCRSDVDILRKCCMEFREMLREITGIDPFEKCLTIASACHEVYRTNFLEKDTMAIFQSDRQLRMKQSNLAVKWLSYVMEENDIRMQHVRNGGEKRVGKYSLDGYCEEFHMVYEFQGCFWHGKIVQKNC